MSRRSETIKYSSSRYLKIPLAGVFLENPRVRSLSINWGQEPIISSMIRRKLFPIRLAISSKILKII